ncbi:MAG TPA: anti-sigma factor [Roseiflexaceae bacterium]
MSHDPTDPCSGFQPQLAAYALGEAEASAELLAHLATCPACQRDLRAYVQVARMLPYDAPDVAPPARLRERILAAVAEPVAPRAPATPPSPRSDASAGVTPRPTRQRYGWLPAPTPQVRRWSVFALVFATLVALLAWNVSLQNQLRAQSAQMASNRQNWQKMIALLNDSTVRWYAVGGDMAEGHFWAAPSGQVACLVVQRLPAVAAGQAYQVWLMHGAERTSGGVFDAHDGNGWILIQLDEPLANYDSIGVTVEPRAGSATPTGPPVLRGALAASHASTLAERQRALRLNATGSRWDD